MIARTLFAALLVIGSASTAIAQNVEPPPRDREGGERRGPRGFWGGGDENQRRQWREWRERYDNSTPEQRREMELDGPMMMTTRTYNLSDEQQKQVRDEMRRMRDERRAAMGPDYERSQQLREQMGELWRKQMQGSDSPSPGGMEAMRNDPKMQELRDQMREIDRKYPMNWEEQAKRIEAMLPAEQAEEGRKRREEFMRNWGNRGGGEPGDRGGRGNRPDRGERNRDDRGGDGDERRPRMERWRDRGQDGDNRDDRPRRRNRDGERSPFENRDRSDRADRADRPQADGGTPVQPSNPLTVTPSASTHAWDVYTQKFINDHQLDKTQSTSAWSIVKTLKDREAGILKAQVSERAAAGKLLNATERQNKIKKLDVPIDGLFKELQNRLNALLTDKQRRASSL